MARKVDKSKKSNIKCKHCAHYPFCVLTGENKKNYWNRCKQFEWDTSHTYYSAEDKEKQEKEKQEKQEQQMIAKVNKAIADLREFCDGHFSCSTCPMQENCEYRLITN